MSATKGCLVSVRPLPEEDLALADQIHRRAFAAQLGVPDVFADRDFLRPRYRTHPDAALGGYVDGELVGSILLTRWGSVGFAGPISVRPDLWDRGIGSTLLSAGTDLFDSWRTRHTGLLTFASATKQVALYQKFGYWPQSLTPVMGKPAREGNLEGWSCLSALSGEDRERCVQASVALTDSIFEGLDVRREILAVQAQQLGETLVLHDALEMVALAVCHIGPSTEAGSGTCYVKFGAVRAGDTASARFGQLLDACEELARSRGTGLVVLGVNTARHEAYRSVVKRGYRARMHGVIMHRHNAAGYNRPGVHVIDDWR